MDDVAHDLAAGLVQGRRIEMNLHSMRGANGATLSARYRRKRWSRDIAAIVVATALGASCLTGCGEDEVTQVPGPVGWAIGSDTNRSAVILHTANGGSTWNAQGNTSLWTGHQGNDISAVDQQTAWAALSASDAEGSRILHTQDGGVSWNIQALPEDVPDAVKGIKGISRNEAWAVGLKGPVMHTLNGGASWEVVPTGGITLRQVNRMDVLGHDIWIADKGNGATGMVHSADYGQSWRQEQLPSVEPGHGPMTATIISPQVAWTTVNYQGDIYRTQDGGTTWNLDAPRISGPNDIDDLSAVSDHEVWAVQNLSGGDEGRVIRVTIVGSQVAHKDWSFPQYVYEGISSFDESTAWVVGFKALGVDPSLPDGSILHTSDGDTWTSQPLPVSDVGLWKVSFVGARR
jgi:photosystem II stability/assembly factor-like uncharacterized protein